jgi:hypothetical protein
MNAVVQARLAELRRDLGPMGLAAVVLVALTAAFALFALKPLQEKNAGLEAMLARSSSSTARSEAGTAGKLATFYRYLQRGESTTDWLAKLYGIAAATGVGLQSATYRTQAASARLDRYEITLPLHGSYAQLRDFLERALAEIPVLSLDQMTLKRESRNDGTVQAELHLTLHLVKP